MPLPFLVPALLGGASFLGGLFGNKRKTQQTSTTSPTLDPAFKGIQDVLVSNIMKRLQQPSSLPAGFAERNTSDINSTYDAANQSLANRLSASGLSQSPIAGAGARYLEGSRASDITRMKQSLPLIERQYQQEDLANALAALGLGRGETTTTTGGGGSALGGGISGLASMLGFLYGSGAFGAGAGGNTGWRFPGSTAPV